MNPQFQLMLQQAIQAFQSGNLDAAELILKRLLQVDSKNLQALDILGLLKASQGKYKEAADLWIRAVRINPNDASIQYNLAKALSDCGLDKESIPHHKKAVELEPKNSKAWLNYGKAASNLGCYEDALHWYDNALSLKPDYAEATLNKGGCLHELKHFEEAINHFDQTLSLKPDYAEAWSNKGVTLIELERYEEAINHFDRALNLKPNYAEAWSNKGIVLNELKHFEEALTHYDKALSLKPDYAEAWSNKGVTLIELERYEEAINHFDRALNLKPDYAEAWSNKGIVLNELKHFEEALTHYDKALSLKPSYAEAWSNKGISLNNLKRYEEAINHFDRALSLKLDIDWVYGELLHTKMKICSWDNYQDEVIKLFRKVHAYQKVTQPFPLLALVDDALLQKKSSEIFAQDRCPINSALGPIPKVAKKDRIRIGYFSADFRNHATGYLIAELFELHDKSQFELIGFSFGPISNDEMRQRLNKSFDQFIEVGPESDIKIAQLARNLNIDIAVDLKGFTKDSRVGIFSYRVAPIQVNYLGYPSTMGSDCIDYIIADNTLIPLEYQSCYSEKVAYLPDSYQVNDRKRVISDKQFTKRELELPENGFVFCCFNNSYKVLPETFDGWMRILKEVDGSVLFLYAGTQCAESNLKKEAEARGVNSSRLIYGKAISADKYLAQYRVCDLFLDTFPYNAGTTASDALWTGLPVLTRMGQSFASRVAGSLLNAIGLPELITNTQEEYEALAIELAHNPQKLAGIKQTLANNRLTTPLFNTPLFTKNLEALYIKMYERYQNDLQPDHISIL